MRAKSDIYSIHRTRLSRERGTIKKDWGGRIPVAVVYPNHYGLGMSNLGFQRVYEIFNSRADTVAERFFLPPRGRGHGSSLPPGSMSRASASSAKKQLESLSLESNSPLRRFSLIACSLSFENDYLNILEILDRGGIPLLSAQRQDLLPLVCAGGITTFLNPEPIADFMDFFLLGEGEALIHPFMDLLKELLQEKPTKAQLLQELARALDFVYVPSLYRVRYGKTGSIEAIEPKISALGPKVRVRKSKGGGGAVSPIVTPESSFSDMVLVELGRGCGRGCRFCAAGFVYRPPRNMDQELALETVKKALEKGNRIGLISPAVSDIPYLQRVTSLILDQGGEFSLSSLRADSLTRGLLEQLKDAGQKSIAIAPEAGSERLRTVINKQLTEEQIMEAATMIAEVGAFSVRLYFLVGLPTESMDDVEEIVKLVKRFKHHMVKASAKRGRIGSIKLSVNCFVPKAFTPFQWHPMDEVDSLKSKQKWLKKALVKEGGVKINFDIPKWAYIQTLLSMGDRRVGAIILRTHQIGGDWKRALTRSDLNPDFFVYRGKDIGEILPWDILDHGISKAYLAQEYRRALEAKPSPLCEPSKCTRCGVC